MTKQLKIFTLEEANQILPELSLKLKNLIAKKEACGRRHDVLFMQHLIEQSEGHSDAPHGSEDLEKEIKQMESDLASLEQDLNEIRSLGCVLRSINKGFVDFFSEKDGQKIFLCWKHGEDSIQYYHSISEGSSKRQPLKK